MGDIKKSGGVARASGRFLLRLPVQLHEDLRKAAHEAGLSLNELCCRRLAAPESVAPAEDAPAVRRAEEMFGELLLAVVAYGSWARGEAQRDSDVDLLVVLDPVVALTRELYRRWDERPLSIEGHPVEPHFVHRHESGRGWTGLWAEAALDGIVLFERGRDISRYLARVRRDVMDGRIVRKTVHGQPYWAEVA